MSQLDYNGFCDRSIPTLLIPCRLRWQPERRSRLRLCSVESPRACHRTDTRRRGCVVCGCVCSGMPFTLGGNALRLIGAVMICFCRYHLRGAGDCYAPRLCASRAQSRQSVLLRWVICVGTWRQKVADFRELSST